MPWITFEGSRRLAATLTKELAVFEYGSGGSTLFLSRFAGSVVSVENNPEWFATMKAQTQGLPNVDLMLVPGVPATDAEDLAFGSRSLDYGHLTFRSYVCAIDPYPDHSFDLVLIDGRARLSAFFRAAPKVRVGGTMVLDDADRSGYAVAVAAAASAGWPSTGRFGPKRYTPEFAQTLVWTKTSEIRSGPAPASMLAGS